MALNMFTHMSTSYLDIQLRLHLNRVGIVNKHMLANLVNDRHTAEVIFDVAIKALDRRLYWWLKNDDRPHLKHSDVISERYNTRFHSDLLLRSSSGYCAARCAHQPW